MDSRSRSPSPGRLSPKPKMSAAARRLQKMNQEQLKQAIKKKRECNAKAQLVVEKLLDPFDDEEQLLQMLRDINQCHYQDIVEERAIMKLCGFPLCKEKVEEIPVQQFHISTATKKVYDLTERKNYCSGSCLRASSYLKAQLLTSPLCLRDQEVIPEFKLMSISERKSNKS